MNVAYDQTFVDPVDVSTLQTGIDASAILATLRDPPWPRVRTLMNVVSRLGSVKGDAVSIVQAASRAFVLLVLMSALMADFA